MTEKANPKRTYGTLSDGRHVVMTYHDNGYVSMDETYPDEVLEFRPYTTAEPVMTEKAMEAPERIAAWVDGTAYPTWSGDDSKGTMYVREDVADALADALEGIIAATERWNESVEAIIGRQPGTGIPLSEAKQRLAAYRGAKS